MHNYFLIKDISHMFLVSVLNMFYIVNNAQIVIYSVCGNQRRVKSTFNARDEATKRNVCHNREPQTKRILLSRRNGIHMKLVVIRAEFRSNEILHFEIFANTIDTRVCRQSIFIFKTISLSFVQTKVFRHI